MNQEYIRKCQQLITTAIRLRNTINPANSLKSQISNYPDLLKSIDILPQTDFSLQNKIGFRAIVSHPLLRISMFHIPKGVVMKLHDHPEMQVISYILSGSMQATCFTPLPNINLFERNEANLRKGEFHFTEPIEQNYHEFNAVREACTFLDILLPDYDEDRPCNYYDYEAISGADAKTNYKLTKLEEHFDHDMCLI